MIATKNSDLDVLVGEVGQSRKGMHILRNNIRRYSIKYASHNNSSNYKQSTGDIISKSLYTRLVTVKGLLDRYIKSLDSGDHEFTRERHASTKTLISDLKEAREDYIIKNDIQNEDVMDLFSQSILLAYQIEKIVRIRYYATVKKEASPTSELAKSVSALSLATTAMALYAH